MKTLLKGLASVTNWYQKLVVCTAPVKSLPFLTLRSLQPVVSSVSALQVSYILKKTRGQRGQPSLFYPARLGKQNKKIFTQTGSCAFPNDWKHVERDVCSLPPGYWCRPLTQHAHIHPFMHIYRLQVHWTGWYVVWEQAGIILARKIWERF